MEVLFSGQIGIPRGHAADAVVQRADNARTGRTGPGLHQGMTSGGSRDLHLGCACGDPAVHRTVSRDLPLTIDLRYLNDDAAVGGLLNRHLPGGQDPEVIALLADARQHDFFAGVFVVHAEQTAIGDLGSDR